MPARLNHNVQLKYIHRDLAVHHADASKQIRHLSSGQRVERPSDDPASLALADGINAEVRAITEGTRNIQQTFSLLQVADGSLSGIGDMVRRMQSLAMEAASNVFNDQDRRTINSEIAQLKQEIDRIAGATTYNGKHLLTGFIAIVDSGSTAVADTVETGVTRIRVTGAAPGTYTFTDGGDGTVTLGNGEISQTVAVETLVEDTAALAAGSFEVLRFGELGLEVTISGGEATGRGQYSSGDLNDKNIIIEGKEDFTFQFGPAETSNDVSRIAIADMRASGPTLNLSELSVITVADAQRALTRLNHVQRQVIEERNRIGAFQNRLQLTIETSANVLERMRSTESAIRELDVAKAVTAMSRSQILSQVATSIAAEADTDIERILSLLQ